MSETPNVTTPNASPVTASQDPDAPVLSVRDLAITYRTQGGDVPAVRGVDLEIGRGEVLGLAGESGCGKSTIVNAILRLLPAKTKVEGSITLSGEDVLAMRPGRLRAVRWTGASVIFQGAMHALNPVQRIGDQIAEAIVIHGQASEREALMRVGGLLEQVGLPPRRLKDYPHELSGGQKQRVMIAMALACSPTMIIADEPTTALDVMVQAQVLKLLKSLQSELGLAMLFITHDLSVLVEVSDRLSIMYAGRVIEEGPAREVFTVPKHPYTEALAASFPTIGDDRFRGKPSGLGGDPPDPAAIPSGCPFHPRCRYAFEDCPTIVPQLYPAGEARTAACLLIPAVGAGAADVEPGRSIPARPEDVV
jgi:peptide/nickel transport system ATP-binding protein